MAAAIASPAPRADVAATVNQIVAAELRNAEDLYSPEYKRGLHNSLARHLTGAKRDPIPYKIGTARADAFLAGQERGDVLWQKRERLENRDGS